jgi:bacterioferritin (cytochrome b1)
MKKPSTIDRLNSLLEAEMSALESYWVHAGAITDETIAKGIRAIIPAEEAHARNLSERIRELGGSPASERGIAGRRDGETNPQGGKEGLRSMLRFELSQEQDAIREYAREVAEIEDDIITLEMLEEQLLDEMRHAKWLKTTLLRLG